MVATVLEGAKRIATSPVTRKEPFTPTIIRRIHRQLKGSSRTLALPGRQSMAFILISYSAFLRCEEALSLRRSHIAIHKSYMSVFIESGKTDKYREGKTVLVARTKTPLDPVIHLLKYLEMAEIPSNSDDYIFRGLRYDKRLQKVVLRKHPNRVSYTTIKDILKGLLSDIGLDPRRYGTHSLRAGGATAAANNSVPERLFKKHGRWRSDDSKDRYIRESIEKRLKVTLNLGL